MRNLFLIALIISVTAGIVFAQVDVPGNALASPQSTATSGRLRSTADNFIRADSYVDVKFDKFYAMLGYQNAPNTANLGFATKVGDLYIGTYYGGTFWANIPNVTYTEQNGTWLDDPNKSGVKSYDTLPSVTGGTAPSNNISVLIGVADMGFRVSLYTNKRLFKDSNFAVYDTTGGGSDSYYKDYESESGVVTPQILWSMTKNLTPNGIKPYFALDLTFTKNYTKANEYSNSGGSWVAQESIIGDSDISTLARIRTGLGGYTLLNKDGFRFSADVDYDLKLTFYDNEYNYIDSSGYNHIKTGFKGTVTGGDLAEGSKTEHLITPSVSGQWSGGPLSFRFKLNLGVPISETISTAKALNADGSGSLVKNGLDSKAVMVGFNPDLRLAAQWKIIPTLALNLGGRINLNTISSTTTEGKYYVNDVSDSSYKKVATSNPASITNSLAMGVTYNATENVTFEVASGASNGRINVFGTTDSTGSSPNGLFYFTNLLVSLKY